ncbi:DUF4962 domain-containing protein [Reinekea marinisedimentorum]|uniref:Heparinase II/III-like protein n=1 Tax=Reinekea marinisedimentorum TaxID=230495 RepID=A0A4R3I2G7_9GAMM|nr:DUF4962 domain-containing protein [Reinekea marinisedimentorum]TCS38845.1 heparinase II/III-like protein [Reinekea marinisedimentorum]
MSSDKSFDAIKKIKLENDKSAGNLVDCMPVKVQQTEVDLTFLDNLPTAHPRLLVQAKDVEAFRANLKNDPTFCKFDAFMNNSTNKFMDTEPYDEPKAYPEETVGKASLWRPYWREMYVQCQMAFNATRNLSIAGIMLNDEDIIAKAKAWTLKLSTYDPEGVTSRGYNDEAAFRVIAAMAWGYDWLYSYFSEEERAQIRNVLIERLEEIMHHLKVTVDLLANPLNSHGVRSISSAVVPTCIALYNEFPKAREYMEYSIEYYAVHYPPWGGNDGAWAEGPDYWNTQMAFLGEAFDLIKSYTSINMFNKEFYKNTGDFPLYCMPVHSKRASFCDQSSIGDFPGLKLAYNIKHYAGVNNKPEYIWYYNQLKGRDTEAHTKFYNYGWWDFGYDDLRFDYLWNDMPEVAPSNDPLLKVFPITGWAAFHSNMTKRDEHVHMVYKCSPFGSISHSHGDQNAFTLHAYGDTLAAITGYYGGFGVDMHLKWRRQTFAKNLPLFDGKGQYAENTSSKFEGHQDRYCIEAGGNIVDYNTEADVKFVEGDATSSYQFFNPELESYKRKIWFAKGKVFVIRDTATMKVEQDLTWNMHTTFATETAENSFKIIGENATLDVLFINDCTSNLASIENVEGFGEVDPAEYKDMEIHRHVEAKFKPAKEHNILTLLVPSKAGEKADVTYKLDGNKLELTIDGDVVAIDL